MAPKAGEKPQSFWDDYFTRTTRSRARSQAVHRLNRQEKFDQVIAVISAALRHRQGQPWMYEALALAMEEAGWPRSEIERAVTSAVEYADSTVDLMYVGAYLATMNFNEPALQVYRQAALLDPVQPDPYLLGLKAARAAGDLEGLKWASLGILGQAWPQAQADIFQAGVGVSKRSARQAAGPKRTKEADQFAGPLTVRCRARLRRGRELDG